MDSQAGVLTRSFLLTPGVLGGVPTLEVEIAGSEPEGVLLWFHGGFYVLGSARASADLAADIARRTRTRVLSVDYRLAPEHPYPAELVDAIAAYRGLLDSGSEPSSVALGGESAGAGLAVAALVAFAEEGLPQPSCAVLSPLADLTLSGASMSGKAAVDPVFTREKIAVRVRDYVGDADSAQPEISPVFADLRGLPPLLVQAGTHELLLDDATRLATAAAAADVEVTLEVTPDVPRVFQAFAAVLAEGDQALTSVGRFLAAHLRFPVAV
jgi:acetyl esterase/lipase